MFIGFQDNFSWAGVLIKYSIFIWFRNYTLVVCVIGVVIWCYESLPSTLSTYTLIFINYIYKFQENPCANTQISFIRIQYFYET